MWGGGRQASAESSFGPDELDICFEDCRRHRRKYTNPRAHLK